MHAMKDIDEIRRDNLRLLEREYGGPTATAAQVGMSTAQFANLRDGAKDSKTGKPRGMRKDTARKIEQNANKPTGWLDVDHSSASADLPNKSQMSGMITGLPKEEVGNVEPLRHPVGDSPNFHRVYVVGKAQGGLPERIWTDGDHLVGAIDEYAEIATPDPQAFICPVVGDSMFPRFMPGEYVLVEPNTPPQLGGTVLVRLATGETMLKRLEHRANGHVRLASWNDPVTYTFREEEISWMYYVAHAVPPEKIKMRF